MDIDTFLDTEKEDMEMEPLDMDTIRTMSLLGFTEKDSTKSDTEKSTITD